MQASYLTLKSTSFAGGIDPRVKLGLCMVGSLATMFLKSPWSLGLLLIASVCIALTATRPQTLARICLFTTIMMAISLTCSWGLSLLLPGLIVWDMSVLAIPFLRMLVIVSLLLHLALSTPAQVISRMLQSMRLPGFLHIPLSVVIRFIPTFMDDCKQIQESARLRPGKNIWTCWRCLVVPLVFRTLASADDLAIAAELKGMHAGRKATMARFNRFTRRDYAIVTVALCVLSAAGMVQKFMPTILSTIATIKAGAA